MRLHLLNQLAKQFFGLLEVGDDAVLQGTHRVDAGRRAPEHLFRFPSDAEHAVGSAVDGDHGGFVEDDPFPLDVDERIGRTEIDGHVTADQAEQTTESHALPTRSRTGRSFGEWRTAGFSDPS